MSLILHFLNSLLVLGVCTFLVELLRTRFRTRFDFAHPVAQGIVFSVFAIVVMLYPVVVRDGVIFDPRNVIIAVAGIFGGGISALIVSFVVIVYRLFLGGIGVPVAVASALTSAALGTAFYYYRQKYQANISILLAALGLAVAVQTLVWFSLLLAQTNMDVIALIAIPLLVTYPFSSWLLGMLLLYQQQHAAMESALNADRAMLRTLIDNVPDYIFVKDSTGHFLLSNSAHTRAAGAVAPGELLGQPASAFFPAAFSQQYDADDAAVLRGESVINQERETVNAAGKPIWVLTTKIPLRNAQGQVIGVVGISRDITEQKRAAEVIRYERNLLRTLIDTVPANVYIKDTQSRFLDANAETYLKFGLRSRDELIGKTDFDFFPAAYAEQYFADEQALLQSGQPMLNVEERTLDNRTGKERWFLTTKAPIRDAQDQIIGLVGVGLDITERKAAEEQARVLAAEQQRSRLLREFITNVSHDFRTPLATIGTSAFLMSTSADLEERARRNRIIEVQLSRLRLLLDSFVEIVQIDHATSEMQQETTDLVALVRSIIETRCSDAQGECQQMTYESESPSLLVLGDHGALAKAVGHVVDNALRYTAEDGTVTLRLYTKSDQGVVEVEDTGIGIATEHLPRIFESFYRVDSARSTTSGGAGLGLSLAKHIIEAMGGRIEVESEPDRGSTFRIYLPLHQ